MQYLSVDGMLSGTGIRDEVDGGFVRINDLGLSDDLQGLISRWLSRYADAHYAQFEDKNEVAELDAIGIAICKHVRGELPRSKVEYFSSALMRKIDFD